MSTSSSCTSRDAFSLVNEEDTSPICHSILAKSEKRLLNLVWRSVRVVVYQSVWHCGASRVASVGKCVKHLLNSCWENRVSLALNGCMCEYSLHPLDPPRMPSHTPNPGLSTL